MLDLDSSPLADIEQAFAGADAIVFAAGSAEGELSSAIDRKGVKRTVLAATKAGVRRYVAISSLGATTAMSESYDWPGMKAYFTAKRAANASVRDSGLDWTIIEPGTLTDGRASGKVALSEGVDIADAKISRADVAAVVVAALADPRSTGRTLQLVAGKASIADALKRTVATPPAPVPAPTAKKPAARKAATKAKPAKKAPAKPAKKSSASQRTN